MSSTSILDLIERADFLFGYKPQLLIKGKKRFKSRTGGFFCILYLLLMLIYLTIQVTEYSSDHITGLISENSRNKTAFIPGRAGFNMAFGFREKSLPEDIGSWVITHVKRHWTEEMLNEKHTHYFSTRKCDTSREFKQANAFEKGVLKNLYCSDIFNETSLNGNFYARNFSYV